ncbi:MOSC domain-containing protein [Bacillus dakarensis]|uniref:MOSC domain-containing protein n=1 Tax=Robertmurraya dakarensis TaxID=1926278 RepID=UPI000981D824|nr:MOSC domain-containing protein [Bacillus dakarensis]
MLIGQIKEIVRHPVKSLRGESVEKTKIMDYGLYGDRSHAYVDETNNGEFLTITRFQEMVRYSARFAGEDTVNVYPRTEVITPEGKVFEWEDEELIKELENKSKRKITTIEYPPSHVPIGPIAVEHIQLVSDASLEKLKELWGKTEVDHRRFRPNIIISLKEKIPFIEETWFGRKIKIGSEVELQVKSHCKRCMITTVDPDNAAKDPSLLKTIAKERQNHFGVYASVIKTGEIFAGDDIQLLE